jgi:hypothetical protein
MLRLPRHAQSAATPPFDDHCLFPLSPLFFNLGFRADEEHFGLGCVAESCGRMSRFGVRVFPRGEGT